MRSARQLATVLLLVLVAATAGQAQERGSLPAGEGARRVETAERSSRQVLDRKFWIVAAALNTAMALDTKSTFDVVRRCEACREANPFVAPFVRRGPAVTFTAGEAFDAGVMTMAARMRRSDRAWVRRTWWVMPAALITGHAIAQRHNANLLK